MIPPWSHSQDDTPRARWRGCGQAVFRPPDVRAAPGTGPPAAGLALAGSPCPQRSGCGSIGLRGDFRLPASGNKAKPVEGRLPKPSRARPAPVTADVRQVPVPEVSATSFGLALALRYWPVGVTGGGTPDPLSSQAPLRGVHDVVGEGDWCSVSWTSFISSDVSDVAVRGPPHRYRLARAVLELALGTPNTRFSTPPMNRPRPAPAMTSSGKCAPRYIRDRQTAAPRAQGRTFHQLLK